MALTGQNLLSAQWNLHLIACVGEGLRCFHVPLGPAWISPKWIIVSSKGEQTYRCKEGLFRSRTKTHEPYMLYKS